MYPHLGVITTPGFYFEVHIPQTSVLSYKVTVTCVNDHKKPVSQSATQAMWYTDYLPAKQ
jgi:hypothetical protein